MKKSFYESGRTWTGRLMIAALATGMFAACSDDDKTEPREDLPTFTNIETKVPETHKIPFTAYDTWTASSNATGWCKVSPQTGIAGTNELVIEVTDDDHGFAKDDVATITFAYTTLNKSTSFTVTRPAQNMVSMFKQGGEEVSTVVIPAGVSNFSTSVSVENNYDWVLTSFPDWLSADGLTNLSGEKNVAKDIHLTVALDDIDTDGLTGELVFSLNDNSVTKSNKLTVQVGEVKDYLTLDISAPYVVTSTNQGSLSVETPFTVISSDGYEFYTLSYPGTDYWLEAKFDGQNADWLGVNETLGRSALDVDRYTVKVDTNEDEQRAALLLVLPSSVISTITSPADLIDSEGDLLEEYRKYRVAYVNQLGVDAMSYVSDPSPSSFNSFYHASAEFSLEELVNTYGTQDVYILDVDNISPEEEGTVLYQILCNQVEIPMRYDDNYFSISGGNNALYSRDNNVYGFMQLKVTPKYNASGVKREEAVEVKVSLNSMYNLPPINISVGYLIFRQGA